LYVYKDSERSDAIQFDLSVDDPDASHPVHKASRVLNEPVSHWVIDTPVLNGQYDLTIRARMAPGAQSNRFAWAYIGYPIFHGSPAP
jgi:hypothetical protein